MALCDIFSWCSGPIGRPGHPGCNATSSGIFDENVSNVCGLDDSSGNIWVSGIAQLCEIMVKEDDLVGC